MGNKAARPEYVDVEDVKKAKASGDTAEFLRLAELLEKQENKFEEYNKMAAECERLRVLMGQAQAHGDQKTMLDSLHKYEKMERKMQKLQKELPEKKAKQIEEAKPEWQKQEDKLAEIEEKGGATAREAAEQKMTEEAVEKIELEAKLEKKRLEIEEQDRAELAKAMAGESDNAALSGLVDEFGNDSFNLDAGLEDDAFDMPAMVSREEVAREKAATAEAIANGTMEAPMADLDFLFDDGGSAGAALAPPPPPPAQERFSPPPPPPAPLPGVGDSDMQAALESLRAELNQGASETEKLREELVALRQKHVLSEAELEKTKSRYEEELRAHREHEEDLTETKALAAQLQRNVEQHKQQANELNAEVARMRNQAATDAERLLDITKRRDAAVASQSAEQATIAEQLEQHEELEAKLRSALDELMKEKQALQEQLMSKEHATAVLEKQRAHAKELADGSAKLSEALEMAHKEASEANATIGSLQQQLEQAQVDAGAAAAMVLKHTTMSAELTHKKNEVHKLHAVMSLRARRRAHEAGFSVEAQSQLADAQAQHVALQGRVAELEAQLSRRNGALEMHKKRYVSEQLRATALKAARHRSDQALRVIRAAQEQGKLEDGEFARLAAEQMDRAQAVEKESKKHRVEIAQLQGTLEKNAAAFKALQQEHSRHESAMRAAKSKLTTLKARGEGAAHATLVQAQKQLEEHRAHASEAMADLAELQRSHAETERDFRRMHVEISKLHGEQRSRKVLHLLTHQREQSLAHKLGVARLWNATHKIASARAQAAFQIVSIARAAEAKRRRSLDRAHAAANEQMVLKMHRRHSGLMKGNMDLASAYLPRTHIVRDKRHPARAWLDGLQVILEPVAAINYDAEEAGADVTFFQDEFERVHRTAHPNLLQIFGITCLPRFRVPSGNSHLEHNEWCYVCEQFPGAVTLRRAIEACILRRRPMPSECVRRWPLQMASALNYMHSRKLLHLGLSCQCVIVDHNRNVRLTDWGHALSRGRSLARQPGNGDGDGDGGDAALFPPFENQKTHFYNDAFMAPEQLTLPLDAAVMYPDKIDVWAWGALLWSLLELRPNGPFPTATQRQRAAFLGGGGRAIFSCRHPIFAKLLAECWHADPSKRPDMGEIVSRLQAVTDESLGFFLRRVSAQRQNQAVAAAALARPQEKGAHARDVLAREDAAMERQNLVRRSKLQQASAQRQQQSTSRRQQSPSRTRMGTGQRRTSPSSSSSSSSETKRAYTQLRRGNPDRSSGPTNNNESTAEVLSSILDTVQMSVLENSLGDAELQAMLKKRYGTSRR